MNQQTPFSDWLAQHGNGHLDDRATATVEVVEAVVLHEKSGTVTLTLDIARPRVTVSSSPPRWRARPPRRRGRFYYVTEARPVAPRSRPTALFEGTPMPDPVTTEALLASPSLGEEFAGLVAEVSDATIVGLDP